MAYEELTGPLDDRRRGDHQASVIAATIANANRGKRSKRYRPGDFLIDWGPRRQSWQEQLAVVEQIHQVLGDKYLRRRSRD